MKKLYRSEHDEVLTGVIGGIGEYFSIDPTVLRIAFVILVLVTGIFPGIIAYIITYFIIPEKPHGVSTLVTPPPMKTAEPKEEVKPELKAEEHVEKESVAHPIPEPALPISEEESTKTVANMMEPTEPETGEDRTGEKAK